MSSHAASTPIKSVLRLVFGRVGGSDHQGRRLGSIIQGVLTGLASRFVSIAIALLSVPLTIGYLGQERYGIWVLLSSILAWIRLADLGIGNGLTNAVTSALGADDTDRARTHISTALAVLTGIAAILGLAILVVWPWLDWADIFGVKGEQARAEVGPAIAASIFLFVIGFPLSIVAVIYRAVQKGALANYWGIASNLAGLGALIVVTQLHGGLVSLVLVTSGTGLLIDVLSALWLFSRAAPFLAPSVGRVRRESTGSLLRVGVPFFLIQIMALIVFQSDNMIIAHYAGAVSVPTYSITYSLFNYTSLLQTIAFSYTWVAFSDAIARKDIPWLLRTFRLNLALSLGSTLAGVIVLLFIAQPFVHLWTRGAVNPSFALILWMAAWSLINAFCSPLASLLAAASHLRAQLVYSAVSAICNVALSIYLIQIWGVVGAVAGSVIAYALFICVPIAIDVALLIRILKRSSQPLASVPDRVGTVV